ncbi:hypothetical protein L1887_35528 [Cichorium endivia]|nr:hypothetical protein L1887_35528 [Cichorium endivia]
MLKTVVFDVLSYEPNRDFDSFNFIKKETGQRVCEVKQSGNATLQCPMWTVNLGREYRPTWGGHRTPPTLCGFCTPHTLRILEE